MDDLDINPHAEAEGRQHNSDSRQDPIRIRKFFPETFIWEELTTG